MQGKIRRLRDNIFTIEVPEWSTQHEIYNISDYTMIKFPAPWGWGKLSILKEVYKIIGSVTADKIDFDPRPYLTKLTMEGPPPYEVYKFFGFDNIWPYTEDAEAAFRSIFYYYYMPDDLDIFSDPPEYDWKISGKLLLLEMVNYKPQ
jgi:hypothetical protein